MAFVQGTNSSETINLFDGVTFGERGKRRAHVLSHVLGFLRLPPLFAEATIDIA